MRNTNAKTNKNTKIQLAIMITSLFTLTSYSSLIQAAELIKAEPIKHVNLFEEAKENLALSFSSLAISQSSTDELVRDTMAKQQASNQKHIPITLTKINLVSE